MSKPGSSNSERPLSSQPAPEYCCSVTYYELNTQIGEVVNVPSSSPDFTFEVSDGYAGSSTFPLDAEPNSNSDHRMEQKERAWREVETGNSTQFEVRGEGDLWVRYLLDQPVFVQSYFLDRGLGHAAQACKIYSSEYIKIFDLRQYYSSLRRMLSVATTGTGVTAAPSVNVDNLRQWCFVRASLTMGWGPGYPRACIRDTPCWIEVHMHRAQQLLDENLSMMPCQSTAPKHQSSRN